MSKSKGKTVTPEDLLEAYSADALRYWSAHAKLGQDTMYDENAFKVGHRLATKIFNASKFTMLQLEGAAAEGSWSLADVVEPIDRAWISYMRELLDAAASDFEAYDYAAVLIYVETAFWDFCDNYLELIKNRAYTSGHPARKSAVATLEWSLKAFLRLFAPFLPYITEEVWSWHFSSAVGPESIHKAPWPLSSEVGAVPRESGELIRLAKAVLDKVRTEKAAQKRSVKWPVQAVSVAGTASELSSLKRILDDLCAAANVPLAAFALNPCERAEVEPLAVRVELSAVDAVPHTPRV
jgi:valyl-tRNA synthetase